VIVPKRTTTVEAGRRRWKGTTAQQRREHALMMVKARQAKREAEINAAVEAERLRMGGK
jgi:hypothetical protein